MAKAQSTHRRRRRGWSFGLVLVVLSALCGVAAQAASAAISSGTFGINPGDLFRLPQSQWDAHLSTMAADGIETVRMGAWWSDLEPGPPVDGRHTYSWSELDERVAALARHGLRWDPLICFSPTWGSKVPGDYRGAPANNDYFASFAAALAQRYGPGGSFWIEHPDLPALPVTSYEIWNEQNSSKYWNPGNAASYADLYAAARAAIHQVDSAAQVVIGGLAAATNGATPADVFLRRMLASRPDLRGSVDAVAFHPYARDIDGVQDSVASFRRSLDAIAGRGVPLMLTEIGWTTTDTSEAQRAVNLARVTRTLSRSDCGIERIAPYAWLGPELDHSDREQWFGIVNENATRKAAAAAYAGAVMRMRGISGAAPSDTVAICTTRRQASEASPRTAKPRLRVRVRQLNAHPDRLVVFARCPGGCRLQARLLRPIRATTARLGTSGFAARHRPLVLRLARHRRGTRAKVRITATRGGHRASRSPTIRLR